MSTSSMKLFRETECNYLTTIVNEEGIILVRDDCRHLVDIYKIAKDHKDIANTYNELRAGGIYFLVRHTSGPQAVYVGRAVNNVARRALTGDHTNQSHNDIDDFWDFALLVVKPYDEFNELEIKALEADFIRLAKQSNVECRNTPGGENVRLGPREKKKVNEYKKDIINIIRNGYHCEFLITPPPKISKKQPNKTNKNNHQKTTFYLSSNDVNATVIYKDGLFDLQPGSYIKKQLTSYVYKRSNYKQVITRRKTYQKFIDAHNMVTTTITFDSPSAVTDFILGGASNGKEYLKTKDNRTYQQLIEDGSIIDYKQYAQTNKSKKRKSGDKKLTETNNHSYFTHIDPHKNIQTRIKVISERRIILLQGSRVATQTTPSLRKAERRKREKLITDGFLDEKTGTVLYDIPFDAPNYATTAWSGLNAFVSGGHQGKRYAWHKE